MQVTTTSFLPIVTRSPRRGRHSVDSTVPIIDDLVSGLVVGYSTGPPFGERMLGETDLPEFGLTPGQLRWYAMGRLRSLADRVGIHGQSPSFSLSFNGLESTLLLAEHPWDRLVDRVPGELVVGVPARDVVFVTGSESEAGLRKVRRAVERVFFAGDSHLLTKDLLVRRDGGWSVL